MEKSIFVKPIAYFAAISTLIQSVVWFILTLIALLAYSCIINVPKQSSESDLFRFYLLQLYFKGPECKYETLNQLENLETYIDSTPAYINKWMISYMSLSIVHFFVSLLMVIYLGNTKKQTFFTNVLRTWCVLSLAILCMDVWISADFTQDLVLLKERLVAGGHTELNWIVSAPVLLMIISARGYILWLINLLQLIYLAAHTMDSNKTPPVQKSKRAPLKAYDNPDARSIRNSEALNAYDLYKSSAVRRAEQDEQDKTSNDISWSGFDNLEEEPVTPVTPAPTVAPPPMMVPLRPKTPPPAPLKPLSTFATASAPPEEPKTPSEMSVGNKSVPLAQTTAMFGTESILNAKKSLRKVEDRKRQDVRPTGLIESRLRQRVLPSEAPFNRQSEDNGFNPKLFEQGNQNDDVPVPRFQPLSPFTPNQKPPEKRNYGKPILAPQSPVWKKKVLAEDNNFY